ncbi:MAG: hypothetical protein N3A69_10190 [Leptospiraceae bacterium]|nr:hypothetical protein [Leptospiraceae bacterium]
MEPKFERLFQRKYCLLSRLQENLVFLNRKIMYVDAEKYLDYIAQNERIVFLLQKIDTQIQELKQSPFNEPIQKILYECLHLQQEFEKKWREFTKSTKIELTELEVKQQLRESLRKKFEPEIKRSS